MKFEQVWKIVMTWILTGATIFGGIVLMAWLQDFQHMPVASAFGAGFFGLTFLVVGPLLIVAIWRDAL